MKTLLPDLQERYEPFKSIYYEHSNQQYQLKVVDDRGIKYFINCAVYGEGDYFEFDAQFTKDGRAININTVSRTSDPEEKYRPYPTIEEIENMFEKMRVAYGSEYYELFTSPIPMGPTKYNIVNIVQEEDGSCSITWLDGDTICFRTGNGNHGVLDIDLPCLISALYDQHPVLFSKFAK